VERYTTGLFTQVPRKTTSAMGRALPATSPQRLQELLTRTAWSHEEMDRLRVQTMVQRASTGPGVLVLDDTGLPKKGACSVGVARQYSGTLGRTDNCQVLVTSHYVDRAFDWPLHARLYLPESWAADATRRRASQVPASCTFQTKGEIGLDLVRLARAQGVPLRAVLSAAGTLTGPQALDVMRGALLGLAAVHRAGLLHGDVKPENILVDRAGVSRLIDFGLTLPNAKFALLADYANSRGAADMGLLPDMLPGYTPIGPLDTGDPGSRQPGQLPGGGMPLGHARARDHRPT